MVPHHLVKRQGEKTDIRAEPPGRGDQLSRLPVPLPQGGPLLWRVTLGCLCRVRDGRGGDALCLTFITDTSQTTSVF